MYHVEPGKKKKKNFMRFKIEILSQSPTLSVVSLLDCVGVGSGVYFL